MAQNDQKKNISEETSITSQEMKEMERRAKEDEYYDRITSHEMNEMERRAKEDDDRPLVPKKKSTSDCTHSSELDKQENNCISENSQLLITPISKNYNKTRPCSKKDWDEQQDRYKRGEQMMWDDSKYNKSKKGDIIAIWKYKKGVSFHHIEKVENTQSRSESWSQNVGQTDRNVILLSPEFSYFKWDKWIEIGGHKRCMGTSYVTTSKNKILNELKKILNVLKNEKYILYKTDIKTR